MTPEIDNGVLEPMYTKLRSRIDGGIERILSGPHWKWKALLAVVAVSLFRAFPSYDALSTNFVETKWRDVQVKFDHPVADAGRIFPIGTHENNLTFRLTVPILAHVFHLRRTGVLILFAFAGVVLLYLVLKVAYTVSANKRLALFVCLATACSWPGVAAFHELRGGYYDAFALCLLLAAFATSSSILTAVFLLLAAWTDERALIGSSFLFVLQACGGTGGIRGLFAGKSAAAIAAVAAYFGMRVYLNAIHSYFVSGSGIGLSVVLQQSNVMPLAIWSGLGGLWILVLLGLLTLFLQKRYLAAAGFCGALAVAIGASLAVSDTTRSMAYCLPAVFVALTVLSGSEPIKQIERFATIGGVISLIVPTYYLEGNSGLWWLYPLPIQIGRWLLPVVRHWL